MSWPGARRTATQSPTAGSRPSSFSAFCFAKLTECSALKASVAVTTSG